MEEPPHLEIFRRIDRERAAEDRAWKEGYRAGFATGEEVGYGRAHHEMAAAWHKVWERVQWAARRPTYRELQRARYGHEETPQAA